MAQFLLFSFRGNAVKHNDKVVFNIKKQLIMTT